MDLSDTVVGSPIVEIPDENTEESPSRPPSGDAIEREVLSLYDRYFDSLIRYAEVSLDDPHKAPDIVQECFLRYVAKRNEGMEVPVPQLWLFRQVSLLVERVARDGRREQDVAADWDGTDRRHDPEVGLHEEEVVRSLLVLLSPREQECIQLRAEGFSYDDIAGILGITSGTVGTLIARASRKIEKRLS